MLFFLVMGAMCLTSACNQRGTEGVVEHVVGLAVFLHARAGRDAVLADRLVQRLPVAPDFLLVDGINPVPLGIEQKTLKKGDSRSLSIAAASVVAKVVRDRIMVAYDRLFPEYGFSGHKGYGSQKHRDAVALHGPCVCHRRTFAGVREHSETP